MLGEGYGAGQTTPQPPPLPHTGPNAAVIGGIAASGVAVLAIVGILHAHRRASSVDYSMFESGWQFQMTLQQPLTLDASRVASAAATAPAR